VSGGIRHRGTVAAAFLAACFVPLTTVRAQSASSEVWPELDVYWTAPSERYRLYGMSSLTRRDESTTQEGALGLHVDYLAWPWGIARTGYVVRQSLGNDSYHEQTWLGEVVFPRVANRLRLRNRTRLELRWIGGAPSQRLRDRLQIDREYTLPWTKKRLRPYATYELYYDTRYHALSRDGYRLGAEITLNKTVKFDLSFVRQNNRFGSPRHVDSTAPLTSFWF
jgi:hypothetical protein